MHDQHATEITNIFRPPKCFFSKPSASDLARVKKLGEMNVYLLTQLNQLLGLGNTIDLTSKRRRVNLLPRQVKIICEFAIRFLGLRDLPALLNTCFQAREIVRRHSMAYGLLDFHRIAPRERFAFVRHVAALRPVHVHSVRLTVGTAELVVAYTLLRAVGAKLCRLSISCYNMKTYRACYPAEKDSR